MRNGLLHRLIGNFEKHDEFFNSVAPAGYTIAINVHNLTPEFYHTTFDRDWIESYTTKRFFLVDPVMHFALVSQGVKRWSEITSLKIPLKSSQFMAEANGKGLNFGLAVVRKGTASWQAKHLLSIARGDREVTDTELVECTAKFEQILEALNPQEYLSKRQIEMLTLFANGETRSTVATELGLSGDTVKKDVESIRALWGAKNITEAVGMAVSRRIINPYNDAKW